jgi:hypothetical protein
MLCLGYPCECAARGALSVLDPEGRRGTDLDGVRVESLDVGEAGLKVSYEEMDRLEGRDEDGCDRREVRGRRCEESNIATNVSQVSVSPRGKINDETHARKSLLPPTPTPIAPLPALAQTPLPLATLLELATDGALLGLFSATAKVGS